MNRSADLETLLEAMADRRVQLLFLDDSLGEMPQDIAKQFTMIRHRFKAVLDAARKPEMGVVIALFGIQDIYTLDKLARRVSTAVIAKSSTGDKWYKNDLKQTFGDSGIRELDRITRKVTRNYDQDVKSRSVITITGYEKTGYLESSMLEDNPFTEILSPDEDVSEPKTPRVAKEKRFTYDVAGDFVTNVQRYIEAKMPDHGDTCALLYPWVIQGKTGPQIMAMYPQKFSERTLYRRISDLIEFIHSGEAARDIGLEIFEPWFRSTMRARGHHVASSESTARGGIDAMVDGVVHSLKCYHQNRNTVTIPLTEISADELRAAELKGRLVLVLLNPFWGTNPRYKELTLEELQQLASITMRPDDPEMLAAAPGEEDPTAAASQPLTDTGLKHPGAEIETETRKTNDEAPARQRQEAAQGATPSAAEPTINEAAGSGVETGEAQKRLDEDLDPVAVMKAKKLIGLAINNAEGSGLTTARVLELLLVQMGRVRDSGEGELAPLIIGDAITYIERYREALP